MISVGSRDGGRELGLEMEGTELEEGEALCYDDDDDDDGRDSNVDPDIALSYIDEKLHSVLGHFQKDFEGGVSAENLGAKFGGYGSFLPTYQRSPSWSHNKSPGEAHNYKPPISPRKAYPEDRRQNSFVSSNASPSFRSRDASGKNVSVGSSLRANGHLPPRQTEQSSSSGVIKKLTNPSDQKTLTVRIKVGAENLSTQKNAELYSGLGLEVSPSSSLDDSPLTSQGFLHETEESPTSILKIMTSFPGDLLLLSPLPESLIHLTENIRLKCETKPTEGFEVIPNASLSSKTSQRAKKLKPRVKNETISTGLTNHKISSDKDANISFLKIEKETDIDTLGCEELVSNALKLPLLLDSQYTDSDPSKRTRMKEQNLSMKEHLNSGSAQETFKTGKSSVELGPRSKLSDYKKDNVVNSLAASPPKVEIKAENSPAFEQSESDISTAKKALDNEFSADPSKHLDAKEGISVSEGGSKKSFEKSYTGKRKEKIIYSINSDTPKHQPMAVSSATTKSGKKSDASSFVTKNDSRCRKSQEKHGEMYKEFFGDLEFEEDDNESICGDMTSVGKLVDSQLVGKRSSSESHSTSKVKHDSNISDKPHTSEKHPSMALAPTSGTGPNLEAPISAVPLVNEDWVSCDKCQKWRLLPHGTNPKSLPDKWVCRMLTWLPGMNRCNVPEEETTNALRALYHPVASVVGPTSDNQQFQHNNIAVNVGLQLQTAATQSAPSSGKKKHGPTKASNSTDLDGQTHSSNSRKKNPTSLVNHSDKGVGAKVKGKREYEMKDSRASKRINGADLHIDDNNCISDNVRTYSKAGLESTIFSNNGSGYDHHKHNFHKELRDSANKDVVRAKDEEIHFPGQSDGRDSLKRRKPNILSGSEVFPQQVSSSGQRNQESDDLAEQMCENEHGKEKKARVSKSGVKDTSLSKTSGGTDRRSRSTKDLPFVPSTSSSSKVSGSHKNKTSDQEVKGSPVESVSSSPLRFATEKVTTIGKGGPGSGLDKDHIKATQSLHGNHLEHAQVNVEKSNSRKTKLDERSDTVNKDDRISSRNVTSGFGESRGQSQKKSGCDGQNYTKDHDKKNGLSLDSDNEKLPKKMNLAEFPGCEKSNSLPPLARVQVDNHRENGNAFDNDDSQKAQIQRKKSEMQNGLSTSSRQPTANKQKVRDAEAPSPLRRDSSSHAANTALKEAKDLKHLADRFKNSGSTESIGIYFQAALKFLHGASLLESGSSESTKHNDLLRSMDIYSSTAKLCEFCAHEYEKSKDMAAASLAYKCVEVAYMRVIYSSNTSASRDRNDLQTALKIVPPGESPSSSASDIDNLNNNQASTDKAALTKIAGSPQVSGSHVITSRSRAISLRIVNFAKDVNLAMDASRKSRIAFSAATSKLGDTPQKEGISALKKALDFNFQDVEGLLRLVRVAMEAISR